MDDILVVGGGGGVEVVFFLLGKFCENNCRLREAILELYKTDQFMNICGHEVRCDL